jgi:hypothetical protein
MSSLQTRAGLLDELVLCSRQQLVLRAVVPLATLVFLALVPLAGGAYHPVLSAGAVLLAVVVALLPESHAALGLLLYLGALWLLAVPDRLEGWSWGGALALGALHLACTLASYGPPGLTLERRFLRLWFRRAVLCLLAALVVWLAARLVGALDRPPTAWALALGLVVVVAWSALLTVRLAPSGGGGGD